MTTSRQLLVERFETKKVSTESPDRYEVTNLSDGRKYYMWSRCDLTEAVDTHRHSGNSHTFLFQNGTYASVGPVVTNPV
jgi:hypothetical protein